MKRIGIFGGSFDPIHFGHLLLAEYCREARQLDEIWFVPAAQSPHKLHLDQTAPQQRAEMIELAIADHPDFLLVNHELRRGGISYTIDTLKSFQEQHPTSKFFLLIGADSLTEFSTWYQPAEICDLADLVVVARPGSEPVQFDHLADLVSSETITRYQQLVVEMPLIELSSSEVSPASLNWQKHPLPSPTSGCPIYWGEKTIPAVKIASTPLLTLPSLTDSQRRLLALSRSVNFLWPRPTTDQLAKFVRHLPLSKFWKASQRFDHATKLLSRT